jgi:outer membrane cobalamin receptor
MLTGRKRLLKRNGPEWRLLLLLVTLFFSLSSSGQIRSLFDTIRISEVIVKGHPFQSVSGNKIATIESAVLKDYSHDNISDVISENTPIFIKSYGSGGIATLSLRGTGAGYTQLAWNGVNINSPMLGQTDLSIVPAGFIDDINIYYGGSSLSLNSGGIGGIINLETKPEWANNTDLLANMNMGSFGRYSGLIKAVTGNKNFQSSTKALFQSAENNFSYLNNFNSNDPVPEKRKNAAVYQNSFMQELYFRRKNNIVSARIWYQNTDRNIPVPIVNQQPENGEKQNDEFLRTMINYSGYRGKSDYSTSLSWFSEKLNYKNPLLSVDSRNLSNIFNLKSGFESEINEKTRISIMLNDEISIVNSVNYNGLKSRNLAGISIIVKRKFGEKIDYTAQVRETLKDNSILIPDFSTGLDYKLLINKEYFVRVNFSHNSRVPTLNDMYWNPGGNILLKNEYSYTGEITYEMNGKFSSALSYNSQFSLYNISMDDMIKWTPGESGYWSPLNIDKANSSGVEGNVSLLYAINSLKIRFSAKYSWNHAHVVRSEESRAISGKQIVYVPEHIFNAVMKVSFKNYYSSLMACYTGKRYTTTDNSEYLPGYLLNNASTGIKFYKGKSLFDIVLKVDNLFNVNYQAIAWYPMPGRSFNLSIIYNFKK